MTASSLNKNFKNLAIVVLAFILMLSIGSIYVIWSKGSEANRLEMDYKEKNNRLAHLKEVEKQYQRESQIEQRVFEALPTSEEASEFLLDLSNFAKETGATISSISFPLSTSKDDKITNYQTKILLTAPTADPIHQVIKRLEANKRLLDILDTDLRNDSKNIQANITIKVYYKNDEKKQNN
ncbi:TPA: hypothetical protein DDW69_02725 [candidate division CPR2 bacterium]|uniref:Uncharacterized protein n=1 Tax=candidate division CPR2 bacterium GW2011_GWC1_41_48 TaxID=1618344 RepID=A0A0G0WAV1_UNCC2|nr:MAG: hypothetical protein UT47_C0003G0253 [candidate division CPR2 bacterium GW2011_GWC2_39_35]KKR28192.1 MAG: hypothetical protein UT59_C0033G0009 [candidate division CPR2 bacterium GW2011_GWD1_39_7]KKR29274.1 MAG: hypothetical protein UT60_C0004G0011 [candidate division CPR2 bacterium GW2011_GWD2_39_7]KKS09192.1 MAG: hypothetical protein UU65_C0003G0247 [candidate division CPR2 bacterium GW2011_GWC1_41_48]OGB70940.1 MAG: hypothetical protein A2Y26_05610 [candidate division CPR2 bacterium G